jgi:hypothetical protein
VTGLGNIKGSVKGSVNEVVMFSSCPLDFFYAAHNQMASTAMNMTFSLTDPFKKPIAVLLPD